MKAVTSICWIIVSFVAGFGFLFGQLFFGIFEFHATVVGVFALLAVLLSVFMTDRSSALAVVVMLCGLVSLVGVAYDIYDYYSKVSPHSGSYYPWIMVGPFIPAMLFIMYAAHRSRPT